MGPADDGWALCVYVTAACRAGAWPIGFRDAGVAQLVEH
jgi:hypothetical protein